MQKFMHRMLSACLVLLMAAGLTALPASADAASFSYSKTATAYLAGTGEYDYGYLYLSVNRASSAKKISAVKSSKTSVASISSYSNTTTIGNKEGSSYCYGDIDVLCKKAGTSNITFTYNSKTYTTKLTVKSYVNPVKTATITGINSGKSIASKTKSHNYANFTLSKSTSSSSLLKVTAATGWKIQDVYCGGYTSDNSSYTSYGSNSWYAGSSPVSSISFHTGALKASRSYNIHVEFVNTSTGGTQTVGYYIN